MSTYFYYKKVRYKIDCYFLHTVLLVIILLLVIAITCCHYAKHRSKLQNIDLNEKAYCCTNNIKWIIMNYELENNELFHVKLWLVLNFCVLGDITNVFSHNYARGHSIIAFSQNEQNLDPPFPIVRTRSVLVPSPLPRTFKTLHQPPPIPFKNSKSCDFTVS